MANKGKNICNLIIYTNSSVMQYNDLKIFLIAFSNDPSLPSSFSCGTKDDSCLWYQVWEDWVDFDGKVHSLMECAGGRGQPSYTSTGWEGLYGSYLASFFLSEWQWHVQQYPGIQIMIIG